MKLPIPFLNEKKEKSEYFLALLLTNEKASAIVLQETLGKLKIINTYDSPFVDSIEELTQEELLETVDKSIGKAEEVLPPSVQTHNTVFGIKESWVEKETKKIKKEYLHKLKKLCDSLDLTPIGFMVTTEAISNLLQKEEGAPVSAILAEVMKRTISLTLLRGGKVVETASGHLEHNAVETVDRLLKHFTVDVLPARIILIPTTDGKKLSQEFIAHQWSKTLPFLHVPQITSLPPGFDAKSVVFGAAVQMGLETTGLLEHSSPPAHKLDEEAETPHEDVEERETKKVDGDEETEDEELPKTVKTDNFGFVVDQDIALTAPRRDEEEDHHFPSNPHGPEETEEAAHHPREHRQTNLKGKLPNFLGLLSFIRIPRFKIPIPSLFMGSRAMMLVPIAGIVILLVAGAALTYIYFYKTNATVQLTVKPKMVQEDERVTFSTTASNDFENNTISAKSISVSVDGSMSTPATGKKQVGDKAKGTVTIYNSAAGEQSISSGTTIKSSNGLQFTLDKDVKVASATGDIFSGTKPGTTQTTVTAKDIGTEYNLPSGTTFSVDSNSSIAAKNDSAFSGGSKKDVVVVSKDDINKLKTDLPKTLTSKANDQLSQKVDGEETVIPIIFGQSFTKTNFDKNAGDQAKTVTLNATIEFSGMSYNNDDITNFAKSKLKSKYSQNISFADNSVKGKISDASAKSDKEVSSKISLEAGVLPDLNTSDLLKQIQDKSPKATVDFLKNQPQIDSVNINYSPNLLFLPQLFPRLPKHVSIVVKPEN